MQCEDSICNVRTLDAMLGRYCGSIVYSSETNITVDLKLFALPQVLQNLHSNCS
ncbi:hypothetical protein DPMN_067500 [Dreissena polymorpha]|uniref:Uncharacterized protein n=1 Tax=Dreissena polymorpha TaxID=45954 RepID=A0A9D4BLD9_DREPO|nr:hypothetical protein DPMN_067500 [Dreissena polymorpha]